jgi:hypothetical protein
MNVIRILFFAIILTVSTNTQAQDEDYYIFMGQSKSEILKSDITESERIVTGKYYELGFAMSEDDALFFYFDKNLLCDRIGIIQKDFNNYDRAKLILSSDFPRKGQGNDSFFYWNSRMMATLLKEKDRFMIIYQKAFPELLKK